MSGVQVVPIDIPTVFRDFDDFWTPFLGRQGAAPTYLATQDAATQQRIRDLLAERLPPGPDGTIALRARAWAVWRQFSAIWPNFPAVPDPLELYRDSVRWRKNRLPERG